MHGQPKEGQDGPSAADTLRRRGAQQRGAQPGSGRMRMGALRMGVAVVMRHGALGPVT